MRAEAILGAHDNTSVWEIDDLIQTETLGPPHSVHQPLIDPGVGETQLIWEYEADNLGDQSDADHSYIETHDGDAEGWVVAGDSLPEDGNDLSIPNLLDSFNMPRLFPPHIPHHAGRGYEQNMRQLWKNESKEAIRIKFERAVVERRKKRKVLRFRWNQVTTEWISMLRRREEVRLENMYGWTFGQELNGGAQNKPWWAPNPGDLGWDNRTNAWEDNSNDLASATSAGACGDNSRGIGSFNSSQATQKDVESSHYSKDTSR